MGFKKPANLEKFRQEVREFILSEMEPIAERIEDTRKLPFDEIAQKCREKGLFSMLAPQKWGGMGMGMNEYFPILAEVCATHGAIAGMVHQQNQNWQIIEKYGNDKQKKEWLPRLCSGEAFRCIAMTEPHTGTGIDIKTTADKRGDRYIINGTKQYATTGDRAEPMMVTAYTDKKKGRHGISVLIVGSTLKLIPGLSMRNLPPMMGNTDYFHGIVDLKDVSVPVENLLGPEGAGLDMFLDFIYSARVRIATRCLGVSQRLLELAIAFAKERETFGKPIGTRQAIQGMLADSAADIYALRSMINDCTKKIDAGTATPAECSMCKLKGIEIVGKVSDNALIIHGGLGYTRLYPVERLYRDGRSLWFEEGTPTIHRLVIARELLKDLYKQHD